MNSSELSLCLNTMLIRSDAFSVFATLLKLLAILTIYLNLPKCTTQSPNKSTSLLPDGQQILRFELFILAKIRFCVKN